MKPSCPQFWGRRKKQNSKSPNFGGFRRAWQVFIGDDDNGREPEAFGKI
jgi:hypothetical protein